MSHFTKLKTELRDLGALRRALEELGHAVEGPGDVRGWNGQTQAADLIVRRPEGYDLGFREAESGAELVVDRWGLKIDADEFLADAQQQYACVCLRDQAAQDGLIVLAEERLADGSIRLVLEEREVA